MFLKSLTNEVKPLKTEIKKNLLSLDTFPVRQLCLSRPSLHTSKNLWLFATLTVYSAVGTVRPCTRPHSVKPWTVLLWMQMIWWGIPQAPPWWRINMWRNLGEKLQIWFFCWSEQWAYRNERGRVWKLFQSVEKTVSHTWRKIEGSAQHPKFALIHL